MSRNSEGYDLPVDYELHETAEPAPRELPKRHVPADAVVLSRWFFYLLAGMSIVGVVFAVLLVAAGIAFVR